MCPVWPRCENSRHAGERAQSTAGSLRADLEQQRRAGRRERLESVLAVQRERAAERQRARVPVPPPLRAAIADFGGDLGRRSRRAGAAPRSGA
jgi:hypothetical protein